jgi:1-acyl-sn-glycerol-3-phosphate acyltransferase
MRAWYRVCLALARIPMRGLMRPQVEGREWIPSSGGLLVAANHLSYWDPPVLAHTLDREVHFLAKEELFRVPVFGSLIRSLNSIPVRRGMADLKGIQEAIAAVRGGGCLLIFPEGSRSRTGELMRARPGVGLLWSHTRVPILPAYLSGTNRVRRWAAQRETVRVRFGRPLGEAELLAGEELSSSRAQYQRIADRALDAIVSLRTTPGVKAAPAPSERKGSTDGGG